jgi:hypothetical protein
MVFPTLLMLHSLIRWLLLAGLVAAVVRGYQGWFFSSSFTITDKLLLTVTTRLAEIQFVVGLALYMTSPLVRYFLQHFSEAVHQRDPRFFGMEHITMMVISVGLISIGAARVKKKDLSREKFKVVAVWFSVALLLIFLSIPWAFSPFTARPYWRPFW